MAKYTELYLDYAKGHNAPSSFSLIEGFEELFLKHFCDKEIGFETETLFEIKLDEKADLIMKDYADRISMLASAWTKFEMPAKVVYESSQDTSNIGAQVTNMRELPFNGIKAQPTTINESEASVNSSSRTYNRNESGYTASEAMQALQMLNGQVAHILQKCLSEFDDLFMKVY